jgi:DNA-binding GntR family transcriptional regulator
MYRFVMPVPLYVQIAEGLLDQIESGELTPGRFLIEGD